LLSHLLESDELTAGVDWCGGGVLRGQFSVHPRTGCSGTKQDSGRHGERWQYPSTPTALGQASRGGCSSVAHAIVLGDESVGQTNRRRVIRVRRCRVPRGSSVSHRPCSLSVVVTLNASTSLAAKVRSAMQWIPQWIPQWVPWASLRLEPERRQLLSVWRIAPGGVVRTAARSGALAIAASRAASRRC
jgi:hypothetical protein